MRFLSKTGQAYLARNVQKHAEWGAGAGLPPINYVTFVRYTHMLGQHLRGVAGRCRYHANLPPANLYIIFSTPLLRCTMRHPRQTGNNAFCSAFSISALTFVSGLIPFTISRPVFCAPARRTLPCMQNYPALRSFPEYMKICNACAGSTGSWNRFDVTRWRFLRLNKP